MANDLSAADLEMAISDLSNALSSGDWNDEVKNSYRGFVEEERRLVTDLKWLTDKANRAYNHVCSVDIGKFKSTYSECASKLTRLQRGG